MNHYDTRNEDRIYQFEYKSFWRAWIFFPLVDIRVCTRIRSKYLNNKSTPPRHSTIFHKFSIGVYFIRVLCCNSVMKFYHPCETPYTTSVRRDASRCRATFCLIVSVIYERLFRTICAACYVTLNDIVLASNFAYFFPYHISTNDSINGLSKYAI